MESDKLRNVARSAFLMGAELARQDDEGEREITDLFEDYWAGVMAIARVLREEESED